MQIPSNQNSLQNSFSDPQKIVSDEISAFESALAKNHPISDKDFQNYENTLNSSGAPSNQTSSIVCQMNYINHLPYNSDLQNNGLTLLGAMENAPDIQLFSSDWNFSHEISGIMALAQTNPPDYAQVKKCLDVLKSLVENSGVSSNFKSAVCQQVSDLSSMVNPNNPNFPENFTKGLWALYQMSS
jgi:hypothetical protein